MPDIEISVTVRVECDECGCELVASIEEKFESLSPYNKYRSMIVQPCIHCLNKARNEVRGEVRDAAE